MSLHGSGHLVLKKHKGDFQGLFGIRLRWCPGIIPQKIRFMQFYSTFLCFFTNALALWRKMLSIDPGTRYVNSMLFYCRDSVDDAVPALKQHWLPDTDLSTLMAVRLRMDAVHPMTSRATHVSHRALPRFHSWLFTWKTQEKCPDNDGRSQREMSA